jgi:hypothetical protein
MEDASALFIRCLRHGPGTSIPQIPTVVLSADLSYDVASQAMPTMKQSSEAPRGKTKLSSQPAFRPIVIERRRSRSELDVGPHDGFMKDGKEVNGYQTQETEDPARRAYWNGHSLLVTWPGRRSGYSRSDDGPAVPDELPGLRSRDASLLLPKAGIQGFSSTKLVREMQR